jgi:hypothetical protein
VFEPTGSAVPDPGVIVALEINDAGRLALGGSMGPEIAQVEGRVLSVDQAAFRVAVSNLRLLRGGEQSWSGEPVQINREFVSSVRERRFSSGRTIALSAVSVGGVAFLLTRSIVGGGTQSPPKPPTDTASTRRIPQP